MSGSPSAFRNYKGKDALFLFNSGTTYNGTLSVPEYVEYQQHIYKTYCSGVVGAFNPACWVPIYNYGITGATGVGNGAGSLVSNVTNFGLYLRTISGGTNVTVQTVGDVIRISSIGGSTGGTAFTGLTSFSNVGGGAGCIGANQIGNNLALRRISGGTGISVSTVGNNVNISAIPSTITQGLTGVTNLGSGNGTLFTSVSANKAQLKTLQAGTNITLTPTSTGITITAALSGASVSPGGSLGHVQFNNTGNVFGGNTGFTYASTSTKALVHGRFNQALGNFAHAEGGCTCANANFAHAEGCGTNANGIAAHTEGFATNAFACFAHAEGGSTLANAVGSHAEGQSTATSGCYSHTEGCATNTTVAGTHSHAEGCGTFACAQFAHAEGLNVHARGIGAHAEGQSTIASGQSSHAEGSGTISYGFHSHAEGVLSVAVGCGSHAEGIRNRAAGCGSHAEGCCTCACGDFSTTRGITTLATGYSSHAEGQNTRAFGCFSHAEGSGNFAIGCVSHAEGIFNCAIGALSHVEGQQNCAIGFGSHVEGIQNFAFAQYSHVEGGGGNIASGSSSHVEGWCNITTACAAHAEGRLTCATGCFSHSEGCGTNASGIASHSGGAISSTANRVTAGGLGSFNHSFLDSLSVAGQGAMANYSAILGGVNHHIDPANESAVIIGGSSVKLCGGEDYTRYTVVERLGIWTNPAAGGTVALTYNPTTRKVQTGPKFNGAGGGNNQIQFNIGGALTGNSGFLINTTTNVLSAPQISTSGQISVGTNLIVNNNVLVRGQMWAEQSGLTDATNIAWNLDAAPNADVTIAGNRTLSNPTNMKRGGTYYLIVKQDATGGRSLAFGSAYKFANATVPTLSVAANAVDILTFISDGTNMYGVLTPNLA